MPGTIGSPRAFQSKTLTYHRTSSLICGSFHREEEIFLVQVVFDLYLSEFEVYVIESHNSDLYFIRRLKPEVHIVDTSC